MPNAPTNIKPSPDIYPPRQEVKFKTAVANWGLKDVKAAFVKEVIDKQFTKYKALELISYKDIEPNPAAQSDTL